MEDYSLKTRLCGHFNDVLSSAFSPDGAMVATASCDTRVIIWDTNSGNNNYYNVKQFLSETKVVVVVVTGDDIFKNICVHFIQQIIST